MLKTKAFWSLFGALVFTTIAFEFFPDPYSKDILAEQGLTNKEIYRRFAIYSAIGVGLLFLTTILFFNVLKSKPVGL